MLTIELWDDYHSLLENHTDFLVPTLQNEVVAKYNHLIYKTIMSPMFTQYYNADILKLVLWEALCFVLPLDNRFVNDAGAALQWTFQTFHHEPVKNLLAPITKSPSFQRRQQKPTSSPGGHQQEQAQSSTPQDAHKSINICLLWLHALQCNCV